MECLVGRAAERSEDNPLGATFPKRTQLRERSPCNNRSYALPPIFSVIISGNRGQSCFFGITCPDPLTAAFPKRTQRSGGTCFERGISFSRPGCTVGPGPRHEDSPWVVPAIH